MTITNDQRAVWAEHGLFSYATGKTGGDKLYDYTELVLSDLLTDLMHYAKRENIHFTTCLGRAQNHYDVECAEEAPQKQYLEALQQIAAISLWGEPVKDPQILREYQECGEYDENGFAPSADTESHLLQHAVEIARSTLRRMVKPGSFCERNTDNDDGK